MDLFQISKGGFFNFTSDSLCRLASFRKKITILSDYDDLVPVAANLILTFLAAVIFEHRIEDSQSTMDGLDAASALKRFTTYWSRVWLVWALAYLFMASFQVGVGLHWAKQDSCKPYFDCIFDLLCNGVNFLFLIIYFVLLRPMQSSPIPWNKIVIAFIIISPLIVIKNFPDLFNQISNNAWQLIIGGMVGMISCVMLAILAGRLDSRYLRPPIWVILCLYIYASLQVFYGFCQPVLDQHKNKFGLAGEMEVAISQEQIKQWSSLADTNKIEMIFPVKKDDLKEIAACNLEADISVKVNLSPSNIRVFQNGLRKRHVDSLKILPNEIEMFYLETNHLAVVDLSKSNSNMIQNALEKRRAALLTVFPKDIIFLPVSADSIGEAINNNFSKWRDELNMYRLVMQILFAMACFFKALMFAFVLWLVVEGRLLKYFQLAILDLKPASEAKLADPNKN